MAVLFICPRTMVQIYMFFFLDNLHNGKRPEHDMVKTCDVSKIIKGQIFGG